MEFYYSPQLCLYCHLICKSYFLIMLPKHDLVGYILTIKKDCNSRMLAKYKKCKHKVQGIIKRMKKHKNVCKSNDDGKFKKK